MLRVFANIIIIAMSIWALAAALTAMLDKSIEKSCATDAQTQSLTKDHLRTKALSRRPNDTTTTTAPLALFLKSNDYQGYGGSHLSNHGTQFLRPPHRPPKVP